MLARFRDNLRWYHFEQRKLEYMLSCISEDAQVYINTGIKNKLLPRFFQTV
jgi:DNA-binding sugar fermentation-stimulating protein